MQDNLKNIPKLLTDLNIWLCYNEKDKQQPKAPRDLKGNLHSINSKLYSFNECLESIKGGFNSGVGIVLKNNGLVVLDYDNCISGYKIDDKLGLKIPIIKEDRAEQITRDLNLINSYSEISPSGKGIHIYLTANTNININTNRDNIEIYTNKFIRVSGNLLNAFMYDDITEDKTKQLNQLLNNYGISASDEINKKTIIHKKDNIYKDLLEQKFKYNNTFTNKEILKTMFNSKKGAFLKQLFYNDISDVDYKEYKIDKINDLLKKGKISRDRYKYLYDSMDTSNSGKSFTLIINLLDFCYGDIKAVYDLFKQSALCKDEYLIKKYANGTEDIIYNQFIPKAILEYVNYRES